LNKGNPEGVNMPVETFIKRNGSRYLFRREIDHPDGSIVTFFIGRTGISDEGREILTPEEVLRDTEEEALRWLEAG
jgi:hypothetical protein